MWRSKRMRSLGGLLRCSVMVLSAVALSWAQTARGDVILQVGEASETVEVVAEAPLLKPDTSELGTTISNQQLDDLPLSLTGEQRSPATFIRLVPGQSDKRTEDDPIRVEGAF